jgi:hypothetical protein
MALSANTNVAAAVANYFVDNFVALQQAGTANTAYIPPQTASYQAAFDEWKSNNADKKFYLIGSGTSYKLASVSGNQALPDGAVPVDLNVAYAIESKELSLTDWVLARVADEIRQSGTLSSANRALTSAPEADVKFDLSTMSQADLQQLLQRLVRVSKDLQSAVALGNAQDRQIVAAALGLAANRLAQAIEQQKLFMDSVGDVDTSDEQAALDAASTPEEAADAQKALDEANANAVAAAALQTMVESFSANLQAAQFAFLQMASTGTGNATMSSVTSAVTTALTTRLRAAADLVMLATSAEALFSQEALTQQTSDGNVLQTASASARQAQLDAVKKVLVDLLNDPTMKAAIIEAMKSSAEALGTSNIGAPAQEDLYSAVATTVINAALSDANYIDEITSKAVDFGQDLSRWLIDESDSATTRDSVRAEGMA